MTTQGPDSKSAWISWLDSLKSLTDFICFSASSNIPPEIDIFVQFFVAVLVV
jgi:hypothetical protein